MFALATPERPALYFTLIGEPPLKMLRYQQQLDFFDPARVGESIHFFDLSDLALDHDLGRVLEAIVRQVEETNPGFVFVDSFQTIMPTAGVAADRPMDLRRFVQRLAVHLTTWQATTFLISEFLGGELHGNPVFTVADGILQLTQNSARNSSVRKLQAIKSRGQAPMPGLHTFRITAGGVQVFPRISSLPEVSRAQGRARDTSERAATGVAGLDALLGGGIPARDAILVTGPSSTGKSALATQFIAAGAAAGEPGVIAVFEEHPREYLRRAATFWLDLAALVRQGTLAIIYIRPLDLSPDETLYEIRDATGRGAAGGDRFGLGLRARAGTELPRGFSRVVLPAGGRADRDRRHGVADDGDRAGRRESALQPLRHLLPRRRYPPAALRRGRGGPPQEPDGGEDAQQRSRQSALALRDEPATLPSYQH